MSRRLSLELVPSPGIDGLEGVRAAAYSPDGRFLATGGDDGAVRLWDAGGSRLIRTFRARVEDDHPARVLAVAFGGDRGLVLAATSDAGRAFTWSAEDGHRLAVIVTGAQYVRSIAVPPDGSLLAAGVGDTVRLWDPWTGQPVRHLTGHRDWVGRVAFNAPGNRLASAGNDGIRIWNPSGGHLVRAIARDAAGFSVVAFDPSGDRVAGTGVTAGAVRIWDARTGRELAVIDSRRDTVGSVAFSPDGRLLVIGGPGRTLRLWDLATGQELGSLTGRRMGIVSSVVFDPDGAHLVTLARRASHRLPPGSFDRPFARWRIREEAQAGEDVAAITHQRRLTHPRAVHSVAFSPDGTRLVTNDGTVRVWELDGDETGRAIGKAGVLAGPVWSPDGTLIAHVRELTKVVLVDPATGGEIRHWDCVNAGVASLAFGPDGSMLAGSLGDHSVAVWDPSTGERLRRLAGPPSVVGSTTSWLGFSLDGTRLAKGAEDGTYAVHLWHLDAGRLQRLYGHTNDVVAVAFSPDGARLASGGWDRSVVLWDAATGDELAELTEHTGPVRSVAFSPDGARLATAGGDGLVYLRDPVTGSPTHRLAGHTGLVLSVAFSPDGTRLATAGDDATVRLWDLAD